MELLQKIKMLIGLDGEEQDALLTLYVELTKEEVFDYCGNDFVTIPDSLIASIVVIKYQRRGTESLSNSNYAGNGEVYLKDYPSEILARLDKLKKGSRKLRTL